MFKVANLFMERSREYGYLYNRHAAVNSLLPPSGWRLPTQSDFNTLSLGSTAQQLKDQGYWTPWSGIERGSDIRGFRGVPSGQRSGTSGAFGGEHNTLPLWTSYQSGGLFYFMELSHSKTALNLESVSNDRWGFGIRLVKENETMPSGNQIMDWEGNVYPVVRILHTGGSLIWTALNWRSKYYNNGTSIQYVESDSSWTTGSPYAPGTGMYCILNHEHENF
jgi:uncharacterized protein (TIGR02145 family)